MSTTIKPLQATAKQRDTLRRAALEQAARTLRHVADQLELAASNPDAGTMTDAEAAAGFVRDDLDAVGLLGWEAETIERDA